ncbi:MAG TPA: fatty acyl-AMP ligase [Chitinophagaceae bacterium]
MTHPPTSLVDILQWRAKFQPNRLAYRFLTDGENKEDVFSYEELDQRARSIGAMLQISANAGDRVLLLLPPGLDFIAAFFGCLYAGVIAVPAYPPHPARLEKMLPVIHGIIENAQPSVSLMSASLRDAIMNSEIGRVGFKDVKLLVPQNEDLSHLQQKWQKPEIAENDIAFLQYTSGSTSKPRGVMVSHANLLHNLGLIEKSFGQSSESHAVIWLPPYHDMGLVGGILQPLYTGYPVTLLPHLMFLQQPLRWLQAIDRYRATTSGGPNFAYDLCVRKIRPEQRKLLDLSCWEVAFNGAEQVYHRTLQAFADYFAPTGFRRESFLPCYGLAEATLLVTGGPKARLPVISYCESSMLQQNKVITSQIETDETRALVGCGQDIFHQNIKIVDAESGTPCLPGQVGEIWLSGPSVTRGYWNNVRETEATFGARLANSGEGPFLRSGDLGFIQEGELFITGRLKNMIISAGNNHYPNDIEKTIESAHHAIRPAGCAAFSINHAATEQLIVIVEIEQKPDVTAEEIRKAIRNAVSLNHDLSVSDIRLTGAGRIPRTLSGKIKHYLCKSDYMAGNIKEIN